MITRTTGRPRAGSIPRLLSAAFMAAALLGGSASGIFACTLVMPSSGDSPQCAYDLGNVEVGRSASVNITVQNTSDRPAVISRISVSGDQQDFSTSGLPSTIGPNATAILTVTFTPSIEGHVSANVDVSSNFLNGTGESVVTVAGTGLRGSAGGWLLGSFTYRDNEGPGQLQLTNVGNDPATGGVRIQASLSQNGAGYQGLGFETQQAGGGVLVCFSIQSPYTGNAYVWRAVWNGSSAQGRFEQLGVGDVEDWSMSR